MEFAALLDEMIEVECKLHELPESEQRDDVEQQVDHLGWVAYQIIRQANATVSMFSGALFAGILIWLSNVSGGQSWLMIAAGLLVGVIIGFCTYLIGRVYIWEQTRRWPNSWKHIVPKEKGYLDHLASFAPDKAAALRHWRGR